MACSFTTGTGSRRANTCTTTKTKLQSVQTPPQRKTGEVKQKPRTIKYQRITLVAEGGRAININKILKYELISLTNDDSPLRTTYKYVMSHILEGSISVADQPTTHDIHTCSVTVIDAMALVQKIGKIESIFLERSKNLRN